MLSQDQIRDIVAQIKALRRREAETEGVLQRVAEEEATAQAEAIAEFGTADPAELQALLIRVEETITAAAERASALLQGDVT